jgi:hypothetical protein
MTVFFYPFKATTNAYINNIKRAFSVEGMAQEFPSPKNIFTLFKLDNRDLLVLNWVEDNVSGNGFFYNFIWIIHLIFARMLFKRIVWIRHNIRPHNHNNLIKYKLMCWVLKNISDKRLTHRPIAGYQYIPHPIYDNHKGIVSNINRDIDYLYFGVIKRYKGLTSLLKTWPVDYKLYIRGRCEDSSLNEEIIDIINQRGLMVDYVNCYVNDVELDNLLSKTKVVILPHLDNRMIVSGAFYHAASFGTNVILRDGEFYRYLKKRFSFVNKIECLDTNLVEADEVYRSLLFECSDESIKNKLNELGLL